MNSVVYAMALTLDFVNLHNFRITLTLLSTEFLVSKVPCFMNSALDAVDELVASIRTCLVYRKIMHV
jgi:hypothetical protein